MDTKQYTLNTMLQTLTPGMLLATLKNPTPTFTKGDVVCHILHPNL